MSVLCRMVYLQNQRVAWMTEIIMRTGGLGEDVLTATGLPAIISPVPHRPMEGFAPARYARSMMQ